MKPNKYIIVTGLLLLLANLGFPQNAALKGYINQAIENNPALKAAHLEYRATLQKVLQVGALPSPEASFAFFVSPVETRLGPQRARASAMQMFPWFGTLKNKKSVAAQAAMVKLRRIQVLKNQLILKLRKVWFQLHELEGIIQLHEDNLKIMRTFEALSTVRLEQGKGSAVDLIRIQIEIEEWENELKTQQAKRTPLQAKFNSILNTDLSQNVRIGDSLVRLRPDFGKSALEDSILKQNDGLQVLQSQGEVFEKQKAVAKSMGQPSFGLGLNYILTGQRTDLDPPQNGKDAFFPMLTVRLPIYRKQYDAAIEEVRLKKEVTREASADLSNRILSDFELAWFDYTQSQQDRSHYLSQIVRSKQAISILVQSYTTGGKDFEEILRMQRKILKYDLEILKAKTRQNSSVARIEALYSKF